MNKSLLIALACLLTFAYCSQNYAVLIAGSNGYENYRHQSDVCHAYQSLVSKGFQSSNIIVFLYNDVASNKQNPFPGQLFNQPNGKDVYKGCKIDYQGKDVTPENYLAVLQGNKTHVAHAGNGRVLESTSSDNVFLYFSDHGAPGLVVFPEDVYLYAADLLNTFKKMHETNKYAKLVYYMEACESGSMFVDLPKNLNIYALSAANPTESSYAAYCGKDAQVNGKNIGSCLGDLFSVNWLEQLDATNDLFSLTLQQQFQTIKKKTNASHVMQWGDISFTSEPIGNYMTDGSSKKSNSSVYQLLKGYFKFSNQNNLLSESADLPVGGIISSRKVRMSYLIHSYSNTPNSQNFELLHQEMHQDELFQKHFDTIKVKLSNQTQANSLSTDFECYKPLVEAFKSKCGKIPDSQHGNFKIFYQFCASSPKSSNLHEILQNIC